MSKMRGSLIGVAVMAGAAAVVVTGVSSREKTLAAMRVTSAAEAIPPVQVVYPQPGPATQTLDLPGTINAWYQTPIYAQVSGYVKGWYKDYGARVKAGDLLATIETPGLDEQYAAAQAQLAVAQAQAQLAALTATRFRALSGTEAVSQQQVDVERADAVAAQAKVQAAKDDVARYAAMEHFKNVVAPFDGTVTSRTTDVGNYVNAGGGNVGPTGTATEMFSVADMSRMRVFVAVPQDYSGSLSPDMHATLTLSQFPGKLFDANVLTTAHAFDPMTRTVTVELEVPNPQGKIWPGTYADVHLEVPADNNSLTLPEQALLFRAQGMQVAVVGPDNKVVLKNVTLGLNLGNTVQVTSGVSATDRVIDNPSDGLLDGEPVAVVPGADAIRLPASETRPPAPTKGALVASRN